MISASTHTNTNVGVPPLREDSGTHYGPEGLSPRVHQQLLQQIDGESPADLLARVWTQAPVGDEHAYVQLLGGSIHYDHEIGGTTKDICNIEDHVPDPALDRLQALTKIDHDKRLLVVGQHRTHYGGDNWNHEGTEVILGPVAEKLYGYGAHDIHPKALADATSRLMSSGDMTYVDELFNNADANPQDSAATRTGTGADPTADAAPADAAEGPRAIDPNITPPSWPGVKDVQIIAQRRYSGISVALGGWYSSITGPKRLITGPKHRPHSAATKARVDLMPDEEIRALLEREPLGQVVKYLAAPDSLYDRVIDWRPQLEDYKPCAAIFQNNLMSYNRDDEWHVEGDCTGMPINRVFVFACFGMTPQVGYNRGLSAAMLLEIYRRTIDEQFRWSGWNHEEGKARVVAGHGIPDDIIAYAKHSLFSPAMENSWTYLINGTDAGDRHFTSDLREKRQKKLEESDDPGIEPPEVAKEMQEYLNGLDQQTFGHGSHGNLRPEQLAKASEAASAFRKEQRRDQANRKLVQMRTHPQPLYDVCDRFPRLKPDPYNQAMNLPPELRHPMYTDRDYELDLDKAHLACYIPVVRREGIEVPTLEKYIAANLRDDEELLERGDLWWDLASMVDTDIFNDLKALRTAVKRCYSSVYGSGVPNMLFRIYELYATLTGDWPDEGTQPLKAILGHPLMEELFATRDKLEATITSRGGLEDASGRVIPLSAWNNVKKKANRWRGVMAYVNCSFEQEIMYPIFREAKKEMERDGKTRFKVWLYQGDGVTIRVHRDYAHEPQIARLQTAVKERADELGVPTRLEVDWPE